MCSAASIDIAAPSDATDQLVFYSKSACAAPGKGAHERVADPQAYAALAVGFPGWRRTLSNFHVAPFAWTGCDVFPVPFPEGTVFNSIEHAFQASKFWANAPGAEPQRKFCLEHAALSFSLAPGNDLGARDGRAAQRARKLVVLQPEELALWTNLTGRMQASAAEAKYAQHPECRAMLKGTAPAQLLHLVTVRGKPSQLARFDHLEAIRDR